MIAHFLRQPLVHFLGIGACLFALFALVGDPPPDPQRPQIAVSEQDAQWLASQYQATWRRVPTPAELERLMDEFVREEIYVREALALGLDQGDTIVRRRLRQKMEFLSEAGAEAIPADDAVLRAHYDENLAEFTPAPRIAFAQVMLADDASEAAALAALQAGTDPGAVGVRTLLPPSVPLSTPQAVDARFGAGVFAQLAELPRASWVGPIQSGYGRHLVWIAEYEPAEPTPFEQVRDRIEIAWRAEKALELRQARFDLLRDRYDILRPDAADVLSE